MAAYKWQKTKFPGVRYREHPSRKHGVKFDRYFAIRYQITKELSEIDPKTGKKKKIIDRKEESIGWSSQCDPADGQNWTEKKAALVLERLQSAAKHGKTEAPTRISEQRAIEQKRREQEEEANQQTEAENVTFKHYFENVYFPTFKVGRKKDTTRKANEHFKNWLEPTLGELPLKAIKPFHLEIIKKNILDDGKSPRTLQYVMATLRQVWNMARRDELVNGDTPTRAIKKPKVDNRRVRFLSHTEADNLLNSLQCKDLLAYYMSLLSLHTGMRIGEICALKWSHINTKSGIIRIMDPKGGEGRAVFMTGQVKAMFDGMKRGEPESYIFTRKEGERMTEMPRIFFKVVDELGLNDGITDPRQKVVAHTLRHTFASWHVTAGTDIYTLKELLGHSIIQMTERYSHLAPGTLQNATKTLEGAIETAGQEKADQEEMGEVVNFPK